MAFDEHLKHVIARAQGAVAGREPQNVTARRDELRCRKGAARVAKCHRARPAYLGPGHGQRTSCGQAIIHCGAI